MSNNEELDEEISSKDSEVHADKKTKTKSVAFSLVALLVFLLLCKVSYILYLKNSPVMVSQGTATLEGREAILSLLLSGKGNFVLESNPAVGHLDPEDPSVRLAVSMKKTEYPRFNVGLLKIGMARDRENRYSLHFEIGSKDCIFNTMSHQEYYDATIAQNNLISCLNKASLYVDKKEKAMEEVDSDEVTRILKECNDFPQKLIGKSEKIDIKYCEALYRQKL